MKRSWMVLALLTLLAGGGAQAEVNQATGAEIVQAARAGAASDIAAVLLRGERTQCFQCIGTVETLLYHSDPYVRQLAGIWLRKRPLGFGPVMVRTREALLDTSETVETRALAAEALGHFADWHSGAPLTQAAANDPDATVRAAAVRALGTLNLPRFQSAVTTAMGDADARVRAAALDSSINMLGFTEHGSILPLLADEDESVRWRAALATAELGIEEGTDALESALANDPSARVRQNAAYALGVLGADVRPALEAATEDEDRWVRSAARVALALSR